MWAPQLLLPVLSHPFPVILGAAASNTTPASASQVVSLPSDIAPGDLLLIFLSLSANARTPSASGWAFPVSAQNMSSTGEVNVGWKQADGSEGSSVTVSISGGTATGAHIALRIGKFRLGSTPLATGTNSANPPSRAASGWQLSPTLWISYYGALVTAQPAITPPSNYRDLFSSTLGTTLRSDIAWRHRMWSDEDPDSFTETGGTITGRGTATVAIQGR